MVSMRQSHPVNGWLVLDKHSGLTSAQAVGRIRKLYRARKAGHAGTLDPAATGLLAIALGEATKTIPHVMDGTKAYRFALMMGQATDTDDAEGSVLATSTTRPETVELDAALDSFQGTILQRPPNVSAIRVGGRRAHDLTRSGIAPGLANRPVRIHRLTLLARPDPDRAEFEMVCGKGTYVRSLARDLGETLGCLGHATDIRRTRSDPFSLTDAVSLDTLETVDDQRRTAWLRGPEAALVGLPQVNCLPDAVARLRNGVPVEVQEPDATAVSGTVAWASFNGEAVATGIIRDGRFHPRRVLAPTSG